MKLRFTHRTFTLAMALFVFGYAQGQDNRNLFLEIGGSGGLGSINFEKWKAPDPVLRSGPFGYEGPDPKPWWFGMRYGIGASPIDQNNGWVVVFPVMGSVMHQMYMSSHAWEVSGGFAFSVTTRGSLFIKSPLAIAYRYNMLYKPFFFRVAYTPIFAWLVDYQWQHWAGVSVGYKLGGKNEK